MSLTPFAAALVVAATWLGEARADSGDKALVDRAAVEWADLEYEKVIELADRALTSTTLAARDRIEAYRLKGSALVVLDRTAEAATTFEGILALDPTYELPPNTSPRILSVFEPARARWHVARQQRLATKLGPALASHRVKVALPPAPRGGVPLRIHLEVEDPSRIAASVALSYRRQGSSYYTTSTSTVRPGANELVIPAEITASPTPYTLELHVRTMHASGVTLRREGTAERPLRVGIAAGELAVARPLTRRWWFWAGVGGIVAGSAFLIDQARDVGPQRGRVLPP